MTAMINLRHSASRFAQEINNLPAAAHGNPVLGPKVIIDGRA